MPSKNNKKLAAAEKAAAKRAETEEKAAASPVVEPVGAPADNAPPTPPTSSAAPPPTSEMASVAITTDKSSTDSSSPTSEKKKKTAAPPYKFPPPTEPLAQGKSKTVITNSFPMEIKKKIISRYDVTVTKTVGDRNIEIVGARGADKQQQNSLFQLVTSLLGDENSGVRLVDTCYDGALALYSSTNQNLGGRTFYRNSADLPQNIRHALFRRNEVGTLTIRIERNTAQPTLNTLDVLQENLNGSACPCTTMLQLVLTQEAKRLGWSTFENGNEVYPPARGAGNQGVHLLAGTGAGLKIAKGFDGKGAAIVVMENRNTQFFASGPLSNLSIRAKLNESTLRAQRYLSGLRVGTTYSPQTFVIHTLSNVPIEELMFDEQSVLANAATLAQRPLNQYNGNLPAIQTRIKDRRTREYKTFSFPIENLVVLPDQKLSPKHGSPPTCPIPSRRFETTLQVGREAHILAPNATLLNFGASIEDKPIEVKAIEVPAPVILYKGSQSFVNREKANWRLGSAKFAEPAPAFKILILYNSGFGGQNAASKSKELINGLRGAAGTAGLTILGFSEEDLAQRFGNAATEAEAIRMKLETLKNLPPNEKPVVIYIDHSSTPTHGALKLQERLCQVVTQHLSLDKSLNRANIGASTLTNILLKLNLKRGGLNHKVQADPMITRLYGPTSNTLVLSYDVCHSSGKVYVKGELCEEPSCVGFSYNATKSLEMFIGDFAFQPSRHERVDEEILKEKTKDVLNKFGIAHGKAPTNIIILRDGVSEGQHLMVYENEFPAIQGAVTEFINEKNKMFKDTKKNIVLTHPSMALLVITKRHANRLYERDQKGQICNVSPLLAVDTVVVKKAGNELLFVSHCPLKGTSQFIAVHTIVNQKVFTKNDEIVRLMAALSCAHQVSTSVVSLPESIYAADEYAKRGADLFKEWKTMLMEQGEPIPTMHTEQGLQYDWRAITEFLSYQNSIFKNIRIA